MRTPGSLRRNIFKGFAADWGLQKNSAVIGGVVDAYVLLVLASERYESVNLQGCASFSLSCEL